MKSIVKILMSGLMVSALVLVSCQKEETENDLIIDKSQEEGFNSKTGNNDSEIDQTSDIMSPLLHMQYDGSLSREEAQASFDVEVSKFMKEEGRANRSEAYVYFQVATLTGTYAHSQTDAQVMVNVHFLTSRGDHWPPWIEMNDPIRNDRENGAYDFFYYRTHIPRADWIEVEDATVALKGTDGWYVKWFDIHMYSDSRYSNATGSSHVYSNPGIWLDNSTVSGWDHYATGNIGTGRVNF